MREYIRTSDVWKRVTELHAESYFEQWEQLPKFPIISF